MSLSSFTHIKICKKTDEFLIRLITPIIYVLNLFKPFARLRVHYFTMTTFLQKGVKNQCS